MRREALPHCWGLFVGASLLIAASGISQCYGSETTSFSLQTDAELDEAIAQGISDVTRPFLFLCTATMMASPQPELRTTGQRAADALIATTAATELLKNLTNLPRPNSDEPRLAKLGLAPPSDGHGFPSGHTSAAFAFATVMADADADNRWLWYGLAGVVGWSRVEVEAHHVWDVVAGAALGTYIARRSLHSDDGLLGVVGLKPKRVKLGGSSLTLGPELIPGGVSLATLEF